MHFKQFNNSSILQAYFTNNRTHSSVQEIKGKTKMTPLQDLHVEHGIYRTVAISLTIYTGGWKENTLDHAPRRSFAHDKRHITRFYREIKTH